ncbi:MAG TPA: hypothetical protein VKB25_05920 [Conexibacter sp.]|nr:hypothetical protein [Conexibacter sp.]
MPIVDAKIDDLRLDLENYRIPTQPRDEAAALKYLFASEDVLDAARLILRDGYFDNEVPIVTSVDSNGYVVLEGNRRVSALKALHNPGLIPGHASEIEALLKRWATEAQDLPAVIRVLVAPDRATARPHIARLHTGLPKRRWSRDQQATFYYSLLDGATTVDDVKGLYPGVEVVRFIKMAVVRRFLAAVAFTDRSLRTYVRGDSLRMSAFEYAYRRREIADAVGIAFDRDGQLLPRTLRPEQIAAELSPFQRSAIEYLVSEFRANSLNTRSPAFREATPEYRALVARLRGENEGSLSPEDEGSHASGNGSPDAPSGATSSEGRADATEGPTQRGPNHPDTKARLDLTGLDYGSTPVNLQRRFHELRAIKFTELPVTAAILLRSVLEMTIKVHFDSTQTPAIGMLTEAFRSVESSYGTDKPLRNTITAIRSGNAQRPGSLQWFNLVAHDVNAVVKVDDVRQAWEQVSPLLRRLLRPA